MAGDGIQSIDRTKRLVAYNGTIVTYVMKDVQHIMELLDVKRGFMNFETVEHRLKRLEEEEFRAYDKRIQQLLNENGRLHFTLS